MASSAQAHFLWLVTEPAGETRKVKVFFSEEAAPDDPELLSKVADSKVWVVGGRRGEPTEIPLKIEVDALVGEIPAQQKDGTVILKKNYGVMTKGADPYLLQYFAKSYSTALPGNWDAVGKKEQLPFEIVPEVTGNELVLKVLWEGKPLAGSQVTVEGPGLPEKLQGDTAEDGLFKAKLTSAGLYSIRARRIDETAGELDGKAYKSTKSYTTLSLNYMPAQVTSAEHQFPALTKGTTSFGAAVVGDDLYVYGGNYGGGHEYSEAEQSGDFVRLNLKNGKAWEALPGGPKLTGLAMVSHDGKLYRVGGFKVSDVAEGKAQLNSQDSVARFDPAKGTWEELPALPEPRSSHDIAVLGNDLYVVGGWGMKAAEGSNDHGWHKTAYRLDLTSPKPEWKALPSVPFERRALSLAPYQGKLYVIGGMQSKGGTTTKVDIFDPATGAWSSGPALLGNSMDGFGTAAFNVDGRLIVTTMSGSIQGLSTDGSHWEYLGQLQHPRFFHETPAWNHGLVVVGGASMMDGKAEALEFLPVGNSAGSDQKAALLK
ncbi:DUF4198 domain-containing protein [Planctomicrobium piriforme]|uniref:N-acetylneuraminic acid mutarotase n=1 Tax=Planctomicrobium piriforme TaxID=1576369 RepID=A0A1I3BJJ9_9PLAN|nr:DUF4198 domain-containing protein [Planctomicrobium piriforme]SFH62099.1 N-acetylneuraminic acid mutarotase [Planctomicrobium piriforme]